MSREGRGDEGTLTRRLEEAIRDEESAARMYGELARSVPGAADADILWSIRQDELKHRELLLHMLRRLSAGGAASTPR